MNEMKNVDVFMLTNNFDYESFMEPAGISILAAILKEKGFSTHVLEPAVWSLNVQNSLKIVKEYNPKILALSILIDANMDQIIELIDGVKEFNPDIKIIVGGQAISMNYKEKKYHVLYEKTEFLMVGESEKIFPVLIKCLLENKSWDAVDGVIYKRDGKLIVNPLPKPVIDLDEIPMIDRTVLGELIKVHPDYKETSVQYGRGCRYACSFCSIGSLFQTEKAVNKLRRRSLDNVYKEIEYLYNEFGMRRFNIEDESFLEKSDIENKKIIEFCRKLKTLPGKIALMFLARIDCVDEEVCRELLEAGTYYIFFGVDTIVEEDLKLFNKGYTKEQVYRSMDILKKVGYSTAVDSEHRMAIGYITWHPYTTLKGLRESLEFFKKYNNTPKLIQHHLFIFGTTPIKLKIMEDGLMVDEDLVGGEFEFRWKFKEKGMDILYNLTMEYYKNWSPLRDGIRVLEKYVVIEKPEAADEIGNVVVARKKMDEHFYLFFEDLLSAAEQCKSIEEYERITQKYINEIIHYLSDDEMKQIDYFCKKYGFQSNVIEGMRRSEGWLMRYRN